MFETAELGRKVSKKEYDDIVPRLRIELLELQQAVRQANFPVFVVFAGVDAAGKGETINILNEWMDPRWIVTHAYSKPSEEERERPRFWRFWRDLPPSGTVGLYLSSWYSKPVLDRVFGHIRDPEFDDELLRIAAFEEALADEGALIIKFWLHLGKDAQKQKMMALQKDPLQSWRVDDKAWQNWEMYDRFVSAAERTLRRTSTGHAPWRIVEGFDARYRELTVATLIRDAMRRHLERHAKLAVARATAVPEALPNLATDEVPVSLAPQPTILDRLDTDQKLAKKDYASELPRQQGRLNQLFREARGKGTSLMLVFEGWDAAGKGGAVRRLIRAFDARDYRVIPFAAPTDEERAHHYLWRFWRHLGRAGRVTVYDRSWYGRVLVERVEGFATEAEWRRAYAEINAFEEQLVEHGIVLLKFWLHITKDEQLERFEARKLIPYKQWKLTDEDWRNREQWDAYANAVNDMIEKTSTSVAPWTLVEANDKLFARVKVVRTVADALEKALLKRSGDDD